MEPDIYYIACNGRAFAWVAAGDESDALTTFREIYAKSPERYEYDGVSPIVAGISEEQQERAK